MDRKDFPKKDRRRAARRARDSAKAARKRRIFFGQVLRKTEAQLRDSDAARFASTHAKDRLLSVHAYSKAKVHCSCPMCAFRYRKKGHKPAEETTAQDMRKTAAMDEREKLWRGGDGEA